MSISDFAKDATGSLLLDPRQRQLYRELANLNGDYRFSEMYLGALRVCRDKLNPEWYVHAAHSLRELMEKLAEVLASRQLPRVDVDRKDGVLSHYPALKKSWEKHMSSWDGESDPDPGHAKAFLQDAKRFFDKVNVLCHREVTKAAFRSLDPHPTPLPSTLENLRVKAWLDLRAYFVNVCHHGRSVKSEEFSERLNALEELLLDRLVPRTFPDMAKIDALLKQRNGMVSSDSVEEAVALMQKGRAQYEYFFSQLSSPDWLRPLCDKGFFRDPPPVIRQGDYVSSPPWPESQYLARMAKVGPKTVCDIILALPETDNYAVRYDCLEAALAMPVAESVRLVRLFVEWADAPGTYVLPKRLGRMVAQLADGGCVDEALRLARALLDIQAIEPDSETVLSWLGRVAAKFDTWSYEQILKRDIPVLVRAGGSHALELLCRLLDKGVRLRFPSVKGYSKYDLGLTSVASDGDDFDHGVLELLVRGVRDAALALCQAGRCNEAFAVLESRRSRLFDRILAHALGRFPDADPNRLSAMLANRAMFNALNEAPEYVNLLKTCFGKADKATQQKVLTWIQRGPTIRRRLRDVTTKAVDDYCKRWRLDRLGLVKEHLSGRSLTTYQKLVAELGQPRDITPPYTVTVWSGPRSPVDARQLETMTVADIVALLRTWQYPGDITGPSPEGLSRALKSAVSKAPLRFAEKATDFIGLDPTYVRGLLAGLRDGMKATSTLPWDSVLDLCAWVVAQKRSIDGRRVQHYEMDPDWGWARSEIAHLIPDMLSEKRTDVGLDLRDRLWSILLPLTDDEDPATADEDGSGLDGYTKAINSVRGMALEAVLHYALWVHRNTSAHDAGDNQVRGFTAMPEVQAVLEKHLDEAYDPSRAIRAVYGRWFPWIYLLDKHWAEQHADLVFPETEAKLDYWQSSWSAFVRFTSPYDAMLDALSKKYLLAVDRIGTYTTLAPGMSASIDQRLAEHILSFVLNGKLDPADKRGLFARFWAKAGLELRTYAVENVGWSFLKAEGEISPDTVKRAVKLWNHIKKLVSAEQAGASILAGFGLWFCSGRFDDDWALTELEAVLPSTTKPPLIYEVVKRLAALSATRPHGTLRCLSLLVTPDNEEWRMLACDESISQIIRNALSSGNTEAAEEAASLVNRLLSMGFQQYKSLLG